MISLQFIRAHVVACNSTLQDTTNCRRLNQSAVVHSLVDVSNTTISLQLGCIAVVIIASSSNTCILCICLLSLKLVNANCQAKDFSAQVVMGAWKAVCFNYNKHKHESNSWHHIGNVIHITQLNQLCDNELVMMIQES